MKTLELHNLYCISYGDSKVFSIFAPTFLYLIVAMQSDQLKIDEIFVDANVSDTDNQRVIVKVKDVNDEPPYFINRPLPMQAVVKLNAPPNTRVFTLQAKDPDTDHNLHYFLVRDRSKICFCL